MISKSSERKVQVRCIGCAISYNQLQAWHKHCPNCWHWLMAGKRISQTCQRITLANR